jgi:hypothetical protein
VRGVLLLRSGQPVYPALYPCGGGGGGARDESADPQSTQSAGPVRFLMLCSISIFLLASLVADRRRQCNSGAE